MRDETARPVFARPFLAITLVLAWVVMAVILLRPAAQVPTNARASVLRSGLKSLAPPAVPDDPAWADSFRALVGSAEQAARQSMPLLYVFVAVYLLVSATLLLVIARRAWPTASRTTDATLPGISPLMATAAMATLVILTGANTFSILSEARSLGVFAVEFLPLFHSYQLPPSELPSGWTAMFEPESWTTTVGWVTTWGSLAAAALLAGVQCFARPRAAANQSAGLR